MLTVLFLCYAAVLVWAILCKLQPPSEILAEQMDKPVLNLYPFSPSRFARVTAPPKGAPVLPPPPGEVARQAKR